MKLYLLRSKETCDLIVLSLNQILSEINRDRSESWEDYNESDWLEGLTWTGFIYIGEVIS